MIGETQDTKGWESLLHTGVSQLNRDGKGKR
jgi:hypothetical protein